MKKITSVLAALFLYAFAYTQTDKLLNTDFIFNRNGHISIHKIGTALDTLPYKMATEWTAVDYYQQYKWDNKSNYLLVSKAKDTGWVRKSTLEKLIEEGTAFYAEEFKKKAIQFTPEEFAKIMFGLPWIGMSEEALIFCFGKPDRINRTINDTGVFKQYVYGDGSLYFYFSNGKLQTIQD